MPEELGFKDDVKNHTATSVIMSDGRNSIFAIREIIQWGTFFRHLSHPSKSSSEKPDFLGMPFATES